MSLWSLGHRNLLSTAATLLALALRARAMTANCPLPTEYMRRNEEIRGRVRRYFRTPIYTPAIFRGRGRVRSLRLCRASCCRGLDPGWRQRAFSAAGNNRGFLEQSLAEQDARPRAAGPGRLTGSASCARRRIPSAKPGHAPQPAHFRRGRPHDFPAAPRALPDRQSATGADTIRQPCQHGSKSRRSSRAAPTGSPPRQAVLLQEDPPQSCPGSITRRPTSSLAKYLPCRGRRVVTSFLRRGEVAAVARHQACSKKQLRIVRKAFERIAAQGQRFGRLPAGASRPPGGG